MSDLPERTPCTHCGSGVASNYNHDSGWLCISCSQAQGLIETASVVYAPETTLSIEEAG